MLILLSLTVFTTWAEGQGLTASPKDSVEFKERSAARKPASVKPVSTKRGPASVTGGAAASAEVAAELDSALVAGVLGEELPDDQTEATDCAECRAPGFRSPLRSLNLKPIPLSAIEGQ